MGLRRAHALPPSGPRPASLGPYHGVVAFVFFMTVPGLAVGLIALAALERAGLWLRVAGWPRDGRAARLHDGRRPVSAAGMELFGAAFQPEGHHALERRKLELVLRDEEHDGAPPRVGVDLDRGVITIRPDPRA